MDSAETRTLRVRHVTTYRYGEPAVLGPHLVRLHPAPEAASRVHDYSLTVTPQPASLQWQQDPHANRIARVLFAGQTTGLRIDVGMTVDMTPLNPFDILVEPSAESWPLVYAPDVAAELAGMMTCQTDGPAFRAFVSSHGGTPGRGTLSSLVALNNDVYRRVRYSERDEGEVEPPEHTLRIGAGSCRDSTWLVVEALRALGCAARFVSGYLLPIGEAGMDSPSTTQAGAGLHAWASVFVPGAGWVGLDPTSGTLCSEAHLPLVSAVHYASAAPIAGTSSHPAESVEFAFEAS